MSLPHKIFIQIIFDDTKPAIDKPLYRIPQAFGINYDNFFVKGSTLARRQSRVLSVMRFVVYLLISKPSEYTQSVQVRALQGAQVEAPLLLTVTTVSLSQLFKFYEARCTFCQITHNNVHRVPLYGKTK